MDSVRVRAALGTIVFTILVPGTVAVVAPYYLVTSDLQLFIFVQGVIQALGIVLVAAGVTIYAWCAFDFAVAGRGTPSPTHPPLDLVARGLYRYSRNSMYVGVSAVVFGEAFYFGSGNQLIYALCVLVGFHVRVVTGEERALRRTFGDAYETYCARVPRWVGFSKKGPDDED